MVITDAHRVAIFRAQTTNVRELESAWKYVNRQLNGTIRKNDSRGISINTKLLAQLYCALAEALFSKIIHTPHGLNLGYISQIKKAATAGGVKDGWIKCAELALMAIGSPNTGHAPNVKQKLTELIDAYIFDPSTLRNKLAHGQWVYALNRENTALNSLMTAEIADLDIIRLDRIKAALSSLASILEDMIKSPNNAHFQFYWEHLIGLESKQNEMATWTMATKTAAVAAKPRI